MTTAAELIAAMCRHFDEQGKPNQPVTVNATREYMRQFFKPEKRGGPLLCGKHEIRCRGFADPQPEQLDIEHAAGVPLIPAKG